MGKKILVPCLDVIMDHLFPEKYTVKDISNTKLEKGNHYYIQTLHTAAVSVKRSIRFSSRLFFPV